MIDSLPQALRNIFPATKMMPAFRSRLQGQTPPMKGLLNAILSNELMVVADINMPTDSQTQSKKAYIVSLRHKLKKHLQLQSASVTQVDRRWLNGFMAAGFHSGLISLSELKLEHMKAHRNAYGERMTEAQEQQLERRLTKLCQMD